MERIELKSINCPICDSQEYEVAYKREYRVFLENNLLIWPAQQVICRNCGMIFTNPQPTDETLEWFYETNMRYGETSKYFRELQLEFISRNISEDCETIFDIGASDGTFLNIAKRKGYVVYGIEPSEETVQEAMDKYGIKLIKGFLNEELLSSFNEKFDIVTALHILEHIQNPIGFLKLAIKITNPCKYVYIEVPDASRPFANNIADFFSNQHLMHFTEGSMRNIADILGLRFLTIEKQQDIPIIRMLLKNETPMARRDITNHENLLSSQKENKPSLRNEYEINNMIVQEYKVRKEEFIQILRSRIGPHVKRIIIYGAGMHTTQLLQSGLLDNIEIDCVVDSNTKKHGMLFERYKVQSPEILKDKNTPVLISSYDSQEEISDYLKANFPHIAQVKLYDRIASYDTGIS